MLVSSLVGFFHAAMELFWAQTGRLPVHNGMDNTELSAADLRMTTVAKKLQDVGYYTVQSGKWHW